MPGLGGVELKSILFRDREGDNRAILTAPERGARGDKQTGRPATFLTGKAGRGRGGRAGQHRTNLGPSWRAAAGSGGSSGGGENLEETGGGGGSCGAGV
ncbi:unnamed protein product [Pleuronectes platessa]|uniref:Uncharacterized protein n=1 Tax=Pleuronectes platessa TaxID=8262 RepID=A0A9N7TI69_PLEPL|nr:unnamed protein product [Pleuronectes platessa]